MNLSRTSKWQIFLNLFEKNRLQQNYSLKKSAMTTICHQEREREIAREKRSNNEACT